MRRTLHLAAAVATSAMLALTVGGCGPSAPATVSVPSISSTVQTAPVALTLKVGKIGLDTPLQPLERDAAGHLQVPPVTSPEVAGWFADGVIPGKFGPAIVAGHVSGRPAGATHSVPGVFAKLDTLKVGDTVEVDRDGEPLTFTVYRVGSFRKDAFPTAAVYGDTEAPELRLITCGGVFDPAAHSYESNIVVFARLNS